MTPNKLADLAPCSQGLTLDCDSEGVIVAVNPSWTPVLGWAEADLLQRKIVDFVHPDDRALAIQRWQGPLPAEPAPPFQCSMRHKDGSYKVMSWTTLAVENHIFANGVEVTAEQEGTAHFDKSIQALYQLHRLATISQLTGGISHDFNNLLQNIVASLELVRRMINSGRGAETEKFIASAINSAQRAAALNQDLRSFSRPKPAEMLAVDMNELISGVSTMLGRSLPHAVKLDLQLSADLWKVRCDNIEAQTAILDLVLNACDAMLDGGIISIQTSNAVLKEGDIAAPTTAIGKQFICIAVTDTGHGMSEEVKQHAFVPFFTTKADGSGIGFGLTNVQHFVRQYGGEVDVRSELGRGTSVRIYLPRDAKEVARLAASAAAGNGTGS